MQTTSALYRQIIAGTHWFETSVVIGDSGDLITELGERILFGGTAIIVSRGGADDGYREHRIVSVKTSMKMFDTDPTVGQAVSQEIEVSILNPPGEIPLMGVVVPYVRACNSTDVSEWIQQGVFHIDTRQVSDNNGAPVLTIHGFDAMLFAEQYYQDTGLNWSSGHVSDTSMVSSIAQIMDVDVDPRTWDVMTGNYQIPFPAQYTLREILCYIASMYVGCFIMNDVGQLRLVSILEMPPETNLLIDSAGDYIVFGHDGTETLTETGNPVILEQAQAQPVEALSVEIIPKQSGSGIPSPVNIRQIQGYTQCEVTVEPSGNTVTTDFSGILKNRIDYGRFEQGTLTSGKYSSNNYAVYIPDFYYFEAGTYTLSYNFTKGTARQCGIARYSSPSEDDFVDYVTTWVSSNPYTFTINEACYLRFCLRISSSTTLTPSQVSFAQVEKGSTATAYTPYIGDGVYSGTLNKTTGVLTIDKMTAVLTHTMGFTVGTRNSYTTVFYLAKEILKGKKAGSTQDTTDTIANWAKKANMKSTDVIEHGEYYWTTANGYWRVGYGTPSTTLAEFNAFLKEHPLQVLCELETPITYQLEAQTISTTAGTNTISANCGDVTVTITRPSEAVRIKV